MTVPVNDPADTPVAEIENLRVEIDGRPLVDGVSLRVLPGRVTALVGASGSGKTTTGLALLGEHPPGARVSGEVRVSGGGPIGYVPQHPAAVLNPARRVGALLGDIAREQVRDLPRAVRRTEARTRVLRALADAQLVEGRPCWAATPTSSPAASSNGWCWPRRCCWVPGSSSRTNPPRARTR